MAREEKINEKKNKVCNLWRKEFILPHSEIITRCRISKSSVGPIVQQCMESIQPNKDLLTFSTK